MVNGKGKDILLLLIPINSIFGIKMSTFIFIVDIFINPKNRINGIEEEVNLYISEREIMWNYIFYYHYLLVKHKR